MRPELKKFGKHLREIRLGKGFSQGDAARILKVHRTYVSSMELGRRNPSLLSIKKLAKAFNVKMSDLLKYD